MPPLINALRNGLVNKLERLKEICDFLGIETSENMQRPDFHTAIDNFITVNFELEPKVREMIEKINADEKRKREEKRKNAESSSKPPPPPTQILSPTQTTSPSTQSPSAQLSPNSLLQESPDLPLSPDLSPSKVCHRHQNKKTHLRIQARKNHFSTRHKTVYSLNLSRNQWRSTKLEMT